MCCLVSRGVVASDGESERIIVDPEVTCDIAPAGRPRGCRKWWWIGTDQC